MGDVYLAQDGQTGTASSTQAAALQFASDADRLRRFQQEARAASALNHRTFLPSMSSEK